MPLGKEGKEQMRSKISGALLLMAGDGGSRLLTMVANIHVARMVDREGYGVVFLGLSILTYAMWGADLGLSTLGARETAKPNGSREFTPGDIFSLKTLLGSAAMIVAGLAAFLFVEDGVTRLVALLSLAALIPSLWQMEWYYQGVRSYGKVAAIRYLFGIGYLLGVWFLVGGPNDVAVVPLVYIGALLLAVGPALLMRKRGDTLLPTDPPLSPAQRARWGRALKQSTPIGLGGLMAQTLQLLPPILLAAMHTDADVGEFGAAFRLAINLMVLDRVFIALFLPAVSNLLAVAPERYPAALRRTFRILVSGGVALSVAVTLFSVPLIQLIYGGSFAGAALPLAVMSWFVTATLLNSFFSYALIAAGVENAFFRSSLVSSSIGILLVLALTWLYGAVGAAIGMTAGECLLALLMYFAFRRNLGISLVKAENRGGKSSLVEPD